LLPHLSCKTIEQKGGAIKQTRFAHCCANHLTAMAPSQGARSSCWSGETAAECEHHGSSSPEESSSASDNETPSDSTLNDEDDVDEQLSAVTGSEPSHGTDMRCPTIFPFHLISGCSSAGRSMTSSRSLTSQEGKTVLGLRGTSRAGGLRCISGPRTRWTLAPSSLPRQFANIYTRPCRNTKGTLWSQADDARSSPSPGVFYRGHAWRREASAESWWDAGALASHEA
jgi:hypothetical protein